MPPWATEGNASSTAPERTVVVDGGTYTERDAKRLEQDASSYELTATGYRNRAAQIRAELKRAESPLTTPTTTLDEKWGTTYGKINGSTVEIQPRTGGVFAGRGFYISRNAPSGYEWAVVQDEIGGPVLILRRTSSSGIGPDGSDVSTW